MELIQPDPLEEGWREGPKSLAPAFVLAPQEVHQLGIDIGVDLLKVSVGVAMAKVLAPTPEERVDGPNLLLQAVEVVVPDRVPDLGSDTVHGPCGGPAIAEEPLGIAPQRLEPKVHPQEVKPLRRIDETGLVGV
jgi:hypothetical protein